MAGVPVARKPEAPPSRTREAPGLLTPAALDGEAEEAQLASVTGLALNPRATGALPGLGVALVLLGAQRVTLAARMRKEPGQRQALGRRRRGASGSHSLPPRPHSHMATRRTAFPKLCPGKHSLTKVLPLSPKKGCGDL